MSFITDTTVLSNFASVGQVDLLRQLYAVLYLSTDVYAEVRAGLEEGYHFYDPLEQLIHPLNESGWLRLTGMSNEQELRFFGQLPSPLHRGEASCLAIARRRGWTLLTDDRAARDEARRLGIPVSGTIGCLVLAVERGLCSLQQANVWLQAMIDKGYHSPVLDLSSLPEHQAGTES